MIELVRRVLMGLSIACLGGAGCVTHHPPAPPVVPPPVVDPSPVCQPGATCGCWHRPPGQNWQRLPDCITLPPPVVVGPCSTAEADLVAVPDVVPQLQNLVRAEITKMGDTTGIDCRVSLDALAARLRAPGRCVIAGQEAVFVQRLDKLWEEYHACYFGTGALVATGKYMGGHSAPNTGTPPPSPPATDACGEPVPPPLTGFNLHGDRRKMDATPQVYGCAFCAAIGLGTMPGNPSLQRCDCPAGNEDDAAKRSACEAKVVGGKPLWRSDGLVVVDSSNPFLASCSECAWIEVCKADGTKCTRVTF